ncbi:MmpS family protein [Mycobacteroides abscessus subsp. abscessus]|nr:membrane protein mmpS4 [Mycobacteroides abscessus subsp. abscessus]SKS69842.1 MmpS family protein [Mycobacteroides abscessus subsp. abscessus]SKW36008.1 MmpS family protein [Mycobacteroides abscessus subsp. abscessus]SKY25250.1 MmpS family protein [Mycobacteroides abscessus subsp. abscessus]
MPLPWSVKFEIGKTTAVGSIMAQGDGSSIGCRIIVDDEVKSEKVTNQTNAFTSCLLKAA